MFLWQSVIYSLYYNYNYILNITRIFSIFIVCFFYFLLLFYTIMTKATLLLQMILKSMITFQLLSMIWSSKFQALQNDVQDMLCQLSIVIMIQVIINIILDHWDLWTQQKAHAHDFIFGASISAPTWTPIITSQAYILDMTGTQWLT